MGLIPLPFLLVELDKPKVCLLVVVHDKDMRSKPMAGILKSREKRMDFLGLLESLTF